MWSDRLNWNTQYDGNGSNPDYAPWTADGSGGWRYAYYNLSDTTNGIGITVNVPIGTATNTKTCNIANITVTSSGTITGGDFTASTITNSGYVFAGVFEIDNTTGFRLGVAQQYPDLLVKQNGQIYTGTFAGQYWQYGAWQLSWLSISTLYFIGGTGNNRWYDLGNWNTGQQGEGFAPTEVPWTATDGSTSHMNLVNLTGFIPYVVLNNDVIISSTVTGSCSIVIVSYINIYGGTWTANNSAIYDGYLYGGTFTGTGLYISLDYAVVSGATIETVGLTVFVPEPGYYLGYIDYPNITTLRNGRRLYGIWQSQFWVNGRWVALAANINTAAYGLFYTNYAGDGLWTNVNNWSYFKNVPDGGPAPEIPWFGSGTAGTNLYLGSGIFSAPLIRSTDPLIVANQYIISGSCDPVLVRELIRRSLVSVQTLR